MRTSRRCHSKCLGCGGRMQKNSHGSSKRSPVPCKICASLFTAFCAQPRHPRAPQGRQAYLPGQVPADLARLPGFFESLHVGLR
eukprot:7196-Hanusia_phi.AAC.2